MLFFSSSVQVSFFYLLQLSSPLFYTYFCFFSGLLLLSCTYLLRFRRFHWFFLQFCHVFTLTRHCSHFLHWYHYITLHFSAFLYTRLAFFIPCLLTHFTSFFISCVVGWHVFPFTTSGIACYEEVLFFSTCHLPYKESSCFYHSSILLSVTIFFYVTGFPEVPPLLFQPPTSSIFLW